MSSRIRIYDNGGKTVDRYTLVVPSVDEPGKLDMYGFSDNPYHPQGLGQYGGSAMPMSSYSHLGKLASLGKLVSIDDLPEQAQRYVGETITTPLPDGYGMDLPESWGKRKKAPAKRATRPRKRGTVSANVLGLGG